MHPKEFMDRWQISKGELAMVLHKKVSTVDHWLVDGVSKIQPPIDVLRRLDQLHVQFLKWNLEETYTPEARQLYELIRDRQPPPTTLPELKDL